MRIGIDGRPLERQRTGVARYLLGLLRMWAKEHRAHEYYLYFEHEVPTDPILDEACFTKRLPARLPLLRQNIRRQPSRKCAVGHAELPGGLVAGLPLQVAE